MENLNVKVNLAKYILYELSLKFRYQSKMWKKILSPVQDTVTELRAPSVNTVTIFLILIYVIDLNHSLLCYDFTSSKTLAEFLNDNRVTLNLDLVLVVAIDLIYAIEYLERKGVIHNEITTSHVLIGRGLRVR